MKKESKLYPSTLNRKVNCLPKNQSFFTIEEIHELIGGPFEMRALKNGKIMIFNPHATSENYFRNDYFETEYYVINGTFDLVIYGNVILCDSEYIVQRKFVFQKNTEPERKYYKPQYSIAHDTHKCSNSS